MHAGLVGRHQAQGSSGRHERRQRMHGGGTRDASGCTTEARDGTRYEDARAARVTPAEARRNLGTAQGTRMQGRREKDRGGTRETRSDPTYVEARSDTRGTSGGTTKALDGTRHEEARDSTREDRGGTRNLWTGRRKLGVARATREAGGGTTEARDGTKEARGGTGHEGS
eukprot:CAMPEP_0194298116 /NCGR_PEP_ID=MMETSP0169-20130528/59986_1 /TAXON_ID=218684 /ORGANISM="Corethron pennatum, Strain L29A3" /LENGTH=169 /DNA_ID=CAMNT_0039048063 /DNA_START=406 /DNA_END=916 /DNA_ORIENTATION=+